MENEKSEKSTICECGKNHLIKNKRRHENSMKHQLFVLKKRENELINFHYREWETEILENNPLKEKIL
jgi:hypothetical protein